MADILIIDDDRSIRTMLRMLMEKMGHGADSASSLSEGQKKIIQNKYDVVLLDVHLPDGSGLDLVPIIRKEVDAPEVLIMTGYGDPDGAEIAIKSGAWDYIPKDDSPQKILLPLQRVIQYCEEVKKVKTPLKALQLDGIVGDSHPMKVCYDLLAQAAGGDISTLITGETGTGKELFARAIHENGIRQSNSFVVIDCAALPDTLIESILFGNIKGAFTGADHNRQGLIQQANKGTLFLDEVGELPIPIQKSFLRVLQEHAFRPVGGNKEIACDFRVLAATNRDLDDMVHTGHFRSDLLFRLKSMEIQLPPLRTRKEDIKAIALHHLTRIFERCRMGMKGISPDFYDILMEYEWPGNVRELVNVLETAVAAAGAEHILFAKHLPSQLRVHAVRSSILPVPYPKPVDTPENSWPHPLPPLKEYRKTAAQEAEYRYLKHILKTTNGNTRHACDIAHIKRSRFYSLLKDHGLSG